MKNNFLITTIIILLSFSLISATVLKGNSSGEVTLSYNTNTPISGWINVSIINEPSTSNFDVFFIPGAIKNINLQSLLQANSLSVDNNGYICNPKDCSMNLTTREDAISKTIIINQSTSKVLGIKITASQMIDDINSIEFHVSSNGVDSCKRPLRIDILDEGSYDYSTDSPSTETCNLTSPYGCYDANNNVQSTDLLVGDVDNPNRYCERIQIPPYKSYLVGANISTTSTDLNKEIQISLEDLSGCASSYTCTATISNNMVQCNITLPDCELTSTQRATVCIKPQQDTPYKINYETGSPNCGSLNGVGDEDLNKDFQIFAYPLKYKAAEDINFNRSAIGNDAMDNLIASIRNNLASRYPTNYSNNKERINCTRGCVIPIRFISGVDNQQLTIDRILVNYTFGGGMRETETKIGEIVSMPPLITLPTLNSKLNLNGMDIRTPNATGNYIFSVKYGSTEFIRTNISVSDTVEAEILPREGYALVNNSFFVLFNKPFNSSAIYTWKFGNATPITTTSPSVGYKFDSTGNVLLTLIITTNFGNSTKVINLPVYTPNYGFNKTIRAYKEAINNFSLQLSNSNQSVSSFAKQEIEAKLTINDLKTDIDTKETLYWGYLDSQEAERLRTMNEILSMKVPSKLSIPQSIKNSKFLQDPGRVKFAVLSEFDAGTIEGNEDEFKKKLNTWISENLDINVESKTYEVEYATGERSMLFTDLIYTLTPKEEISDLYFIVDSPSLADKIKVSNLDLNTKESKNNDEFLITLKDLTKDNSIKIEFLYPAEVSVKSLPVYISPDLTKIGGNIRVQTGTCNNDKRCDSGEDYKNCPGDCKPWGLAIILIVILIFIAIVVYIIMQEWYKRHYESYLFTNKTQLFNLINFMYTSSNQGTNKTEIFSKLKSQGWTTEQLDYAWKKFKGQRVGMWEIPVFKWVENKQVKEELIKRNPGMTKKTVIK